MLKPMAIRPRLYQRFQRLLALDILYSSAQEANFLETITDLPLSRAMLLSCKELGRIS